MKAPRRRNKAAATPGRRLIGALDVGTSKIGALIAERGEGGQLTILGTGQRSSRGVKRGYVTDMAACEGAIREAMERAERIAGTNIEQVFVGFSAGGLVSEEIGVMAPIGGRQVEQSDLDALLIKARDSIDPGERTVLHAMPAFYTLDGAEGIKHPLGLHADRLSVEMHVIAAEPSPARNLDLCVRSAHLGVEAIVASPVAASLACLSEEELELGVALVEIGAGVTNISVYAGGTLLGLKSLPIGGEDITVDVASIFGIGRDDAERIKCKSGSALTSPRDNHHPIEVAARGAAPEAEPMRFTRAELVAVIRRRLEAMTGQIAEALKTLGFAGPLGRQVVLTGGGAELEGIADYAQGALGRTVRIGEPKLAGMPVAHVRPGFSTLAGLALFAASDDIDLRMRLAAATPARGGGSGNVLQRLITAFRSSY